MKNLLLCGLLLLTTCLCACDGLDREDEVVDINKFDISELHDEELTDLELRKAVHNARIIGDSLIIAQVSVPDTGEVGEQPNTMIYQYSLEDFSLLRKSSHGESIVCLFDEKISVITPNSIELLDGNLDSIGSATIDSSLDLAEHGQHSEDLFRWITPQPLGENRIVYYNNNGDTVILDISDMSVISETVIRQDKTHLGPSVLYSSADDTFVGLFWQSDASNNYVVAHLSAKGEVLERFSVDELVKKNSLYSAQNKVVYRFADNDGGLIRQGGFAEQFLSRHMGFDQAIIADEVAEFYNGMIIDFAHEKIYLRTESMGKLRFTSLVDGDNVYMFFYDEENSKSYVLRR